MDNSWDALPPRKHRNREPKGQKHSAVLPPLPSPALTNKTKKDRKVVASLAAIAANITDRSLVRGGEAHHDDILDNSATIASSSSSAPPAKKQKLDANSNFNSNSNSNPPLNNDTSYDVLKGGQYEYLDHTADVQLHAWGLTFEIALAQLGVAMFGYMTDLNFVETTSDSNSSNSNSISSNSNSNSNTRKIEVSGHDISSLVYNYLDEWLFVFHDTGFLCREIENCCAEDNDLKIKSVGRGEVMDLRKHKQGTEVKAITYSAMKIVLEKGRAGNVEGRGTVTEDGQCHIHCIIDI